MDNKKKVFVVKNNYDEIESIYDTESEAKQLCAYLNGKYLKAQKDIPSAVHTINYKVKSYPIREFYRHKKLYWLIVVYFEKYPTNLLNDCPYAVANIEKNRIVDFEMEDEFRLRESGVHHIFFTTSIKTTEQELKSMAYHKLQDLWNSGKIQERIAKGEIIE